MNPVYGDNEENLQKKLTCFKLARIAARDGNERQYSELGTVNFII